jgi:hypothetical protein
MPQMWYFILLMTNKVYFCHKDIKIYLTLSKKIRICLNLFELNERLISPPYKQSGIKIKQFLNY